MNVVSSCCNLYHPVLYIVPLPTCMMLACRFSLSIQAHSTTRCIYTLMSCTHLYKLECMHSLCHTLTFSCLCFTVLSLRRVGRCVRFTCWRTRFLCVQLSGSGCLTPPASLVWRQVRGGHASAVPSDPYPATLAITETLTPTLGLNSTSLKTSHL